jgi:NADH-quinone oxidoreductase subunit J
MLVFLFNVLAILYCISAIMVVFSKNPVHSVLCLILVFLINISFFFILGADFIGFVFMIVYVGAIAVLFLFIVMMLNIRIIEMDNVFVYYLPISILIIFVFLFEFNYALVNFPFSNLQLTFNAVYSVSDFSLFVAPFSSMSLFGYLLYTYFAVEFIFAGFILFLAMIGSIALTLNQIVVLRREDIFLQLDRRIDQSIRVLNFKK